MLPPSIRCQPFLRVMSDAVLWFSSGDTKSVLHFDEYDNINCLLDGSKEFLLADKVSILIFKKICFYLNRDLEFSSTL